MLAFVRALLPHLPGPPFRQVHGTWQMVTITMSFSGLNTDMIAVKRDGQQDTVDGVLKYTTLQMA